MLTSPNDYASNQVQLERNDTIDGTGCHMGSQSTQ